MLKLIFTLIREKRRLVYKFPDLVFIKAAATTVEEKAEAGGAITNIVCWHFLEALKKKLYGHFWKCPNGDQCKYRHNLPPGYVMKEEAPKVEDSDEEEV